MKKIQTKIIIQAEPKAVWKVLTDFEKYASWNPFIRSIFGEKRVGKQLIVKIALSSDSQMSFRPVIVKFEQHREFSWMGKLLFRGIFDGEHYFKLVDNRNGTTTLIHGENFSGLLVGFFGKTLNKTKDRFVLMNEAIKKECENL